MSKLHECKVQHLRPTQITVGMIEVHDKRKRLRDMEHDQRKAYLREHVIPAVYGCDGHLYITDHHHLGRALTDEGIEHAWFLVEADFSVLTDRRAFWQEMQARQWVHPIDAHGHRKDYADIPGHLGQLLDDPYRSLAGYVRNAGGYQKTPTAFAEFAWADFFRARIRIGDGPAAFDAAVARALALAHSAEARGLPGYIPG